MEKKDILIQQCEAWLSETPASEQALLKGYIEQMKQMSYRQLRNPDYPDNPITKLYQKMAEVMRDSSNKKYLDNEWAAFNAEYDALLKEDKTKWILRCECNIDACPPEAIPDLEKVIHKMHSMSEKELFESHLIEDFFQSVAHILTTEGSPIANVTLQDWRDYAAFKDDYLEEQRFGAWANMHKSSNRTTVDRDDVDIDEEDIDIDEDVIDLDEEEIDVNNDAFDLREYLENAGVPEETIQQCCETLDNVPLEHRNVVAQGFVKQAKADNKKEKLAKSNTRKDNIQSMKDIIEKDKEKLQNINGEISDIQAQIDEIEQEMAEYEQILNEHPTFLQKFGFTQENEEFKRLQDELNELIDERDGLLESAQNYKQQVQLDNKRLQQLTRNPFKKLALAFENIALGMTKETKTLMKDTAEDIQYAQEASTGMTGVNYSEKAKRSLFANINKRFEKGINKISINANMKKVDALQETIEILNHNLKTKLKNLEIDANDEIKGLQEDIAGREAVIQIAVDGLEKIAKGEKTKRTKDAYERMISSNTEAIKNYQDKIEGVIAQFKYDMERAIKSVEKKLTKYNALKEDLNADKAKAQQAFVDFVNANKTAFGLQHTMSVEKLGHFSRDIADILDETALNGTFDRKTFVTLEALDNINNLISTGHLNYEATIETLDSVMAEHTYRLTNEISLVSTKMDIETFNKTAERAISSMQQRAEVVNLNQLGKNIWNLHPDLQKAVEEVSKKYTSVLQDADSLLKASSPRKTKELNEKMGWEQKDDGER